MGDTLRSYDSSVVQDSNSAVLPRTDSFFFFFCRDIQISCNRVCFFVHVREAKKEESLEKKLVSSRDLIYL